MTARILVAEDDLFYRLALAGVLREWGYEVVEAGDGLAAWDILQSGDAPKIAILDWMMPGLDMGRCGNSGERTLENGITGVVAATSAGGPSGRGLATVWSVIGESWRISANSATGASL